MRSVGLALDAYELAAGAATLAAQLGRQAAASVADS
jgi:hypothetical protein